MKCFTIPETGIKLVDGSIVKLARFPNVKWVVHYGWYTYNDQQFMGWYFCSIPTQTIIPINEEDLRLLSLVNSADTCPPPPMLAPYPGPTGSHCHPGSPHLSPNMVYELDRAFLSVDTVAQRDELNKRLLPHGKIVRVNNVDGLVKYYQWNQVNITWEEISFGGDGVNSGITESEADARYAAANHTHADINAQLGELDKELSNLDERLAECLPAEWGDI